MKLRKRIFQATVTLLGLLFMTVLIPACAIKPMAWEPSPVPAYEGDLSINEELLSSQTIDLGGWYGPEDIIFDEAGNLYCGVHKGAADFSDGKILKISPDGDQDIFYDAGSWVAGLHFDQQKNLIALSHRQGLISISPNGEVEVLASQDEQGRPFLIPNGLDIAADGMIYFSNTSSQSTYNIKYGRQLILELKPTGGLFQYDPKSKKVSTLIDGLNFGNGVVLSQDEDYLLIVETTKYRVLKYWLEGAQKGKTEVFLDNLPGFPNGISRSADGSFWLGFTTKRNEQLDNIHHKPGMKKLVYGLPGFLQPKQEKFGLVMHISEEGKTLQALFDPSGTQVPEAGAVKEHQGKLYLGGDIVPYISVYSLIGHNSKTSLDWK